MWLSPEASADPSIFPGPLQKPVFFKKTGFSGPVSPALWQGTSSSSTAPASAQSVRCDPSWTYVHSIELGLHLLSASDTELLRARYLSCALLLVVLDQQLEEGAWMLAARALDGC